MAGAYIDENGFHIPDYPDTLKEVKENLRAIFGPDLYLEADSQEGQLAAIWALAMQDAYSLAFAVYQAFSPHTAQGAGLSRMVAINGIRRHESGQSTVVLRIVGQPGTIIRNGVAEDNAGQKWDLPANVSIPLQGEISVMAKAREAGAIRAQAGEITQIGTPTRGWQTVENPEAAIPGRAIETDGELRERQAVSTALPSLTVFEGTIGAVANVEGVTRWRGYENDTSETDDNGLPPHSICMVVEGGDPKEIADAIAVKKTPGCYTYGDTEILCRMDYGVPSYIRFFYAKPVRVRLKIFLKPLAGYLQTTGTAIKAAVASFVNTIAIGEDVLLSRLLCPINESDLQGKRTFDVSGLEIARDDGEFSAANLTIAFNEAAKLAIDDIEFPGLE